MQPASDDALELRRGRADFDAFADDYVATVDRSVAFTGRDSAFFAERKVELLGRLAARHVGGLAGADVLDVGCGTGTTDRSLADKCRNLVGVDISEEMLVEARASVPGVEYRWYDGRHLPFEDGHFDVVLAACVLHHIDPDQREEFAAELSRVTRPGGLVAIFEHNPLNPLTRRAVRTCPVDDGVVLWSEHRTTALLRAAGLEDARGRHYLFSTFGGSLGSAIDRLLGWLPLGGQYVTVGSPSEQTRRTRAQRVHPSVSARPADLPAPHPLRRSGS